MNKLIASSKNPDQLSMTVTGILTAIVPILVAVFQALGIEIAEGMIFDIIQQISVVISGLLMLYGMLRKAFFAIVR